MNSGARRELGAIGIFAGALLASSGRRWSAAAVAALGGALIGWQSERYSYRSKVVAITGGSRGLGFALARNLLRAGAKVALLARNAEELEVARVKLAKSPGGQVLAAPCDVTQPESLAGAVRRVVSEFGTIDVWINDAGAILIGPIAAMTEPDFNALLDTQVRAVLTALGEVMPVFREAGGGRIVNICSIGGKIAVPHMAPYSTAKFALAGLSAAMNAELAAQNVKVTTVFPGIMRVGSAIQAIVKGSHAKEYAWFALGSVTPLLSVSADRAARTILAAAARGDAQVVFPAAMKAAALAHAVFPELSAWAGQQAAALLPSGADPVGKTGAQSESALLALPGAKLLKAALASQQRENNESPRSDARFNLGLNS